LSASGFPDVELAYELRFTHKALEDLRCRGCAPGDLEEIEAGTPWPGIVEEFRSQRSRSPDTTGGSLARMGRGDILPLHGPAGGRAATWFDAVSGVCWFVGFSPEHNYELLERRAVVDELLPDEEDETALELEREELDFDVRVGPGLRILVRMARETPSQPARGTVGELLRLEVTATVVSIEESELVDLWLIVQIPVEGRRPSEWPGGALLERIAQLATGRDVAELELKHPDEIPTSQGARALDRSRELGIQVCNWEP
jgi:hypothetical protein